MAKRARARGRKDAVTLTKSAFIGFVLFIVASTIFIAYAFMSYAK